MLPINRMFDRQEVVMWFGFGGCRAPEMPVPMHCPSARYAKWEVRETANGSFAGLRVLLDLSGVKFVD